MSLFDAAGLGDAVPTPLAERLRPQSLDEVVGQKQLLGEGGKLRVLLKTEALPSIILYGPPGTGKTTIARLIAKETGRHFEQLSAIFSGVPDLKKAFAEAEARRDTGRATLLFVDELHRFDKRQQDSFLPHMETGLITLVGATTENPSFAFNRALLSRAVALKLERLTAEDLEILLQRAEKELAKSLPVTDEGRAALIAMADGDGRALLSLADQIAASSPPEPMGAEALRRSFSGRAMAGDKSGDIHYDFASLLQKSIRGSDDDAALYWTARMLEAGEDPMFIFRRLTVIASEDIGNADPRALQVVIAAREAFRQLGEPEGHIPLGQAVAYLATAPKSNASYSAFKKAMAFAKKTGSLPPPMHAVNAPTKLMKEEGRGEGYEYDHDAPGGHAGLSYLPEGMERLDFYQPVDRGYERVIAERLALFRQKRQQRQR
ncbi:replication-associated recombination protein A [Parvularcula lutaonensis]|uniref:Replication-associated recombination protein A n=1 Tax=Parvularcula lutaonensis TaxID=491923 RepID=A0ABV7MBK3_9PROT|nr:replication-associated recombination protein A [Parvularcula lutaonensis]GGY40619.1 ATPase AAA [Parvularcula lutaonensis]